MKKRLIKLLIISGAALPCIAPGNAHAEEGVAQMVARSNGIPLITNLIIAEASPAKPVVPEPVVLAKTTGTQMPQQYRALVDVISKNNGVDPDLIDAMMKTESNYVRWA